LDFYHTSLAIVFAPLAGFVKSRRAGWLTAALGGVLLGWYLFTHRIDRFWVPLLPAGCVLAGAGLDLGMRHRLAAVRGLAWAAAGAGVLFNLGFCLSVIANPIPFGTNPEEAGVEIERSHAPLIAALNDRFGPDATVVLIGEAQVFGTEFTPIYAAVWNDPPLADPDEPLPDGIAGVAVNWNEIARYRNSYGFDPRVKRGFLDDRVRRGELLPPKPLTLGDRVVGELFLAAPPGAP
ncbi:MAG: hypothetical protein AAF907_13365, partial [Planctomycetota bacterium]